MEPLGWWGSISGWARILGLAFAALDLILLVSCLVRLKKEGVTGSLRERLSVAVGILPVAVVFAAYTYALPASKKVEACGACHVMEVFEADLKNPKSENLAAVHHRANVAHGEECFACHSDYGLWGDVHAKFEGLGHIIRASTGRYTMPIRINKPYPNVRCLSCHATSRKYLESASHIDVGLKKMAVNEVRCLDCHTDIHPAPDTRGPKPPAPAVKKASR
ncbi:MAG: hypothetical protein ABIQ65_08965 [Thermoanaerobaculia bacterium]